MSSNPFAALFEDVDQASDPMLAEAQLSDVMFAPLSPPDQDAFMPGSTPAAATASSVPPQNQGPVRETIAPFRTKRTAALPAGSAPVPSGARAIQAALVVTIEKRGEPDLNELNDLLASGWRVATTAPFQQMEGGGRTAMLIVVEQEAPQ